MHITPLYAALLALLFVGLSLRTLRLRRKLRIVIGDAGNETMLRAMRVHSNFAEYVPLSLFLILLVEVTGASGTFVHGLGLAVLAGRVLHAWGVSQVRERFVFRVLGMFMTLAPITIAALRLLRVFAMQALA